MQTIHNSEETDAGITPEIVSVSKKTEAVIRMQMIPVSKKTDAGVITQTINIADGTHPGKDRTNNEDALIAQTIWDDRHVLGVVIDGVGGYEGGEEAARIAKETIVEYLEKSPRGERLRLLELAVTEANNRIFKEREIQHDRPNMSCVLTSCLIEVDKKRINMAHVGDSRMYRFYKGEMKKLSHDHSYVGYREEIGDLSEEEAMHHPRRNEINRLLGDKERKYREKDFIEAETFKKPLSSGDIFLICSDGLTDMITESAIKEILIQKISLADKVEMLIDLANDKGGKDNITVVLIEYLSDEDENIQDENIVSAAVARKPKTGGALVKTDGKRAWPNRKTFMVLIVILAFLLGGVAGGWLAYWYAGKKCASKHEPDKNEPIEAQPVDPGATDGVKDSETDGATGMKVVEPLR